MGYFRIVCQNSGKTEILSLASIDIKTILGMNTQMLDRKSKKAESISPQLPLPSVHVNEHEQLRMKIKRYKRDYAPSPGGELSSKELGKDMSEKTGHTITKTAINSFEANDTTVSQRDKIRIIKLFFQLVEAEANLHENDFNSPEDKIRAILTNLKDQVYTQTLSPEDVFQYELNSSHIEAVTQNPHSTFEKQDKDEIILKFTFGEEFHAISGILFLRGSAHYLQGSAIGMPDNLMAICQCSDTKFYFKIVSRPGFSLGQADKLSQEKKRLYPAFLYPLTQSANFPKTNLFIFHYTISGIKITANTRQDSLK